MTTINRLANLGITLDVSADTLAEVSAYDEFDLTYEEIKAMSKEEREDLYKKCTAILDGPSSDIWSAVYHGAYSMLTEIEDEEFREENMAEFKAYEAKMGQPDFDWGFYSDWHKDMFGYRPHYEVIPQTEEAREQLFHAFHAARGL